MGTTLVGEFVRTATVFNTHEHMVGEETFLKGTPNVLSTIFHHYMWGDLRVAGASHEAVERLMDAANPDIAARFRGVEAAWHAVKLTGYGEAVSIAARHFYGIEELSADALVKAQPTLPAQWPRGERRRLLQQVGNYDHIQIDDFEWSTLPEPGEGDFFLKDLSWFNLSSGLIEAEKLQRETGVAVRSLESLREAMAKLFALYGPTAVAVKTPHAYNHTLAWVKRSDEEVRPLVEKAVHDDASLTAAERLCLGDWCLARGVELSIEYQLPFKIHTGYKAGSGFMYLEGVAPALLTPLLIEYPAARFVLMHTGYPFAEETLGLAKHFPNVWIDLCWAWALNPRATGQFVRSFVRSVPLNKIFGFGGDAWYPHHSVAFGLQMRRQLAATLDAAVSEGDLSERAALDVAERLLQRNQVEFFNLARVRAANRAKLG